MVKIYQIYPSNNRFLCGCCTTGPMKQLPGLIYIYIYSLANIVPFSIFVVGQNWKINPVLPLLFFVCILLMYVFMHLTVCSNPGIVPRRPFLELNPQKYQKYLSIQSVENNNYGQSCRTCHIIRPKRTSHCSSCQNCVEIFDHHCGVLGTCIGKRNYRYFILFITFLSLAASLLIVNMIVFIVQKMSSGVGQIVIIVVLSIFGALIGLPILGFLIFHIYLSIKKKTTRELLRHIETDENNEQSQWCNVDPPIMDLFDQITEEQANTIKRRLAQLELTEEPIQYPSHNKLKENKEQTDNQRIEQGAK